MHAEGRISIPIKENAGMDEELPPCKYTQKIGPMRMKASLEGKYKGDFDCIKIYTESKAKFMLFSEKEYSMSWYAKGVGIVKEERYNKRGKLQESMTLEAIRKQGNN